jgi:dTDP-4-dehydrorhamnose reductase
MGPRILVTGATGQLGAYLIRELTGQGADFVAWCHSGSGSLAGIAARPVELGNAVSTASAFRDASPEVVIHAAAIAAVADCARDPQRADAVNHRGTAMLAELTTAAGAKFVFVSTDLVFDGERAPYREDAVPSPLSIYGRTKAEAERAVLEFPQHVVARVSLLFGPSRNGRSSFFDLQTSALRNGQSIRVFHDEWRTPLALTTAAQALVAIARSDVTGIIHVGGPERLSRLEMGQRLAAHLGVDQSLIASVSRTTVPGEPRPPDTSLDSRRWRDRFPHIPWPRFEEALASMSISSAARTCR